MESTITATPGSTILGQTICQRLTNQDQVIVVMSVCVSVVNLIGCYVKEEKHTVAKTVC